MEIDDIFEGVPDGAILTGAVYAIEFVDPETGHPLLKAAAAPGTTFLSANALANLLAFTVVSSDTWDE